MPLLWIITKNTTIANIVNYDMMICPMMIRLMLKIIDH